MNNDSLIVAISATQTNNVVVYYQSDGYYQTNASIFDSKKCFMVLIPGGLVGRLNELGDGVVLAADCELDPLSV